jgi:hypothetical protein
MMRALSIYTRGSGGYGLGVAILRGKAMASKEAGSGNECWSGEGA